MHTAVPAITMFQEILAATDFSDSSLKAVGYAKAIARRFGSHLVLAHVSQPVVAISPPEAVWFDALDVQVGLEDRLESEVAGLRSEGMKADAVSLQGAVTPEILIVAASHASDLIVIGTHRRHGVDRLILGSTAETLLRKANCPVLTVGPAAPETSGEWWPSEMVCATSLVPESAHVAAFAHKLATRLGAGLALMHVETARDLHGVDNRARFEQVLAQGLPPEFAKETGVEIHISPDTVAQDIIQTAIRRKAGLIVLAAEHAWPGVTHLTRGVVAHVLTDAPCPVLTLMHRTNQST